MHVVAPVLPDDREERAGEANTHNLKSVANRTTISAIKEEQPMCIYQAEEQSPTTKTTLKVLRRKLHSHIATNDVDIDAEPAKKVETNEKPTRPPPSHAPPIVSASTRTTSETREVPRELAVAKKRGRPKKAPESVVVAVRAAPSKPSPSAARETSTNQVPDCSELSKLSASHRPPAVAHVQTRHHVDEDVDWLFAPTKARSKPGISMPRVTEAQQKKRKISARDLPEMDLEELLSGITSLAAVALPQVRSTKRMKG